MINHSQAFCLEVTSEFNKPSPHPSHSAVTSTENPLQLYHHSEIIFDRHKF